ncbi:hypothetical protein, partial [Burkholderia vietnamiensis]
SLCAQKADCTERWLRFTSREVAHYYFAPNNVLFDNREGLHRTIGNGFSVIFPGCYRDGDYPLVEINVNRNYLAEDEDAQIWDARLPGAAAIRSFLSKHARDIGTQDDIDLRECHADLEILQKDFWNKLHGEWLL